MLFRSATFYFGQLFVETAFVQRILVNNGILIIVYDKPKLLWSSHVDYRYLIGLDNHFDFSIFQL